MLINVTFLPCDRDFIVNLQFIITLIILYKALVRLGLFCQRLSMVNSMTNLCSIIMLNMIHEATSAKGLNKSKYLNA